MTTSTQPTGDGQAASGKPEAPALPYRTIGDEITRREALARREGNKCAADLLLAALDALRFVEGVLEGEPLSVEPLVRAERLRSVLADLPAPDAPDAHAWILCEDPAI